MDGQLHIARDPRGSNNQALNTLPDPVLRVTPTGNVFRDWLRFAGGHAHSVVPPGAVLDADWLAWRCQQARERGGDPARVVAQVEATLAGGKAPGLWSGSGWRSCAIAGIGLKTDPYGTLALRRYERSVVWHGGSVGVWAGKTPGLDVDVVDAGLSDLVLDALSRELGCLPWRRVGLAPKFLVPLRLRPGAPGFGKRWATLRDERAGVTHRIELLGAGQQWVAAGVHGGTMKPYTWWVGDVPTLLEGDDPMRVPGARRGLPEVDEASAVRLLDCAIEVLVRSGGLRLAARGGGPVRPPGAFSGMSAEDRAGLLGPEDLMRSAVAAITNELEVGRDAWIVMAHALKGTSGGAAWGLECFLDWSARWPGGSDPDQDLTAWQGVRDPRIGARWLVKRAEQCGWTGGERFGSWLAAQAFDAMDGTS
jgi:hypothetical protein